MNTSNTPYTPEEMREQLFERFMDAAVLHGSDPNFTPVEQCMQTVRSVVGIIDGEKGNNQPDGLGVPLYQLLPGPHPEFEEARKRQGLRPYSINYPLNSGLEETEYSTGLGQAFEKQFDERFLTAIKERTIKAAKELFGDPT